MVVSSMKNPRKYFGGYLSHRESLPGWLNRLGVDTSLRRLAGSSPTRGGRLFADARNQQPFEPGEWGMRVVLSGHFCASLHVGHARRIRPVFNYRITDMEAKIKTNKTNNLT